MLMFDKSSKEKKKIFLHFNYTHFLPGVAFVVAVVQLEMVAFAPINKWLFIMKSNGKNERHD